MSDTYHQMIDRTILKKYEDEFDVEVINTDHVAQWALKNELWDPPRKSKISLLKKDLANALRSKKVEDSKGRKIKANHCLKEESFDDSGRKIKQAIWAHIDVATFPFMEKVMQQNVNFVADTCCQMELTRQYFNEKNSGKNPPLELNLDFTETVADRLEDAEYIPEPLDLD